VIIAIRLENIGGITNRALIIRIVLSWAVLPRQTVINMSFARWVVETQQAPRKNGYRVLQIRDTREGDAMRVNPVGEIVVAYTWEAVSVERD